MKKTIFTTVIMLGLAVTANAQIFKKLGKSIERAATKTVERKVEQQATKETEKVFDNTVKKTKGIGKSKKRKSSLPQLTSVAPANSYSFDHRIEIRYTVGKDVQNVDYFISKTGNFLGLLLKEKRVKDKFLAVYDIDREAMFSFVKSDGKKIKMGVKFETEDAADDALNETAITIKATGKIKKIRGYNCKEYVMKGDNMTAKIWVTKEVSVRLPTNYHKIKQKGRANQSWMEDIDGWAMEMVLIDTSKRKARTIVMECISINNSSLEINTNEYSNIGQ